MCINIYINFNISEVKMYREYERYDSVLCSLIWFKYIKRKSRGSYNRRGWVYNTLRVDGSNVCITKMRSMPSLTKTKIIISLTHKWPPKVSQCIIQDPYQIRDISNTEKSQRKTA